MKLKYFCLIPFLFFTASIYSQIQSLKECYLNTEPINMLCNDKIVFPVIIHYVYESDGGGVNYDEDEIVDCVENVNYPLNDAFSSIGVSFVKHNVENIIYSDDLYDFGIECSVFGGNDDILLYDEINNFMNEQGLGSGNNYFHLVVLPDNLCLGLKNPGGLILPDIGGNIILAKYQHLKSWHYKLPHEFGHAFGLYHVFEENVDFSCTIACNNFENQDDGIIDTPCGRIDKTHLNEQPNCNWYPNNEPNLTFEDWNIGVKNIMNYSQKSDNGYDCRDEFTELQKTKMIDVLYEEHFDKAITSVTQFSNNPVRVNDGIAIYGGSPSEPDNSITVRFDIQSGPLFNTGGNLELKKVFVNGVLLDNDDNCDNHNDYLTSLTSSLTPNRYFFRILNLPPFISSSIGNNSTDITFVLTNGSNTTVVRGTDMIYFANPQSYSDIVNYDGEEKPAILESIEKGIFKGINNQFLPNHYLTYAQAAKIICTVGLKSKNGFGLDLSPNATPNPLDGCHWAYPYVQTLINKGVSLNGFQDNAIIPYGTLCYYILKTFLLSPNNSQINESRYEVIVNGVYDEEVEKLQNIFLSRIDQDGFGHIEPLRIAAIFDNTTYDQATFTIDSNQGVERADAAYIMVNLFRLLESQNQSNLGLLSQTDLLDWNVVGGKLDIGSGPDETTQEIQTGSEFIHSNETLTLTLSEEDYNGNPVAFYWTVKGGTLEPTVPSSFNEVIFTPPPVSVVTTFDLYIWVGNTEGEYAEGVLSIVVSPNTLPPITPTIQASNITFSNITNNSVYANWTRGNGEGVIVTCTPCGQAISPPVDGVSYASNYQYPLAPTIGNSRVIYKGTDDNRVVFDLAPSSCYIMTAYEFNGSGSNTLYQRNSPAQGTFNTLGSFALDFEWDPVVIVEDEPIDFTWISSLGGLSSENWTFEGGTPAFQSGSANNIYFYNPGVYTVTLEGYYGPTNQWETVTKQIEVLPASTYAPDFTFSYANVNPSQIKPGGNIEVNWSVVNQGVDVCRVTWINYYLSTNNTYDGSDTQFTQLPNDYQGDVLSGGQSISGSRTLNIPSSTSTGNKYILLEIESEAPNYGSAEINFNNNWIAIPLEVVPQIVDLTMQNISISTSTVSSGELFDATVTFTNVGNMSCCIGDPCIDYNIFLSTDNVWSPDDGDYSNGLYINDGYWCVSDYHVDTPGETLDHTRTISTQDITASGNYYLIFVFDTDNDVIEGNENNNVFAVPLTVSNPNQPTVQASNLSLASKTSNSVTLNWSGGNGSGAIIMAQKEGNYFNPVDGYDYTANTNWNNAGSYIIPDNGNPYDFIKIVYEGNGNQATITGLSPETTWYFSLFEYNSSGTSRDYLQSDYETLAVHLGGNQANTTTTYLDGDINNLEIIIYDIVENDNAIYVFGTDGFFLKSIDDGDSYEMKRLGNGSLYMHDVEVINDFIIAANADERVYVSTDAGETWNTYHVTLDDKSSFTLHSIDEQTHLMSIREGDVDASIYRSLDGGQSWGRVHNGTTAIYDIENHPEGTIWACGEGGILLRTYNDGITWTAVSNNLPSSAYLYQMQFISETIGFIRSDEYLYKTTDGGSTWNSILPVSYVQARDHSFVFIDANVGYLLDKITNTVHKTIDGGNTWTSFLSYTDAYNIGLVAGNNDNVFLYGGHITEFDACTFTTYYEDNDNDGFGNPSNMIEACSPPSGYVSDNTDCNDNNATIYPIQSEACDGIDNNCNGQVDECCTVYYQDNDGDGYGSGIATTACSPPSGYVTVSGDCNDNDASINVNSNEVCDGVDNDCDGQIDEGVTTTYYEDNDGDGYGSSIATQACSQPSGYVSVNGDCNDADSAINPSVNEVCDYLDNNCNGQIDEGVTIIFYQDNDGDGYGSNITFVGCTLPIGYSTIGGDCNDNDSTIHPNAGEPCDGIDNDCSGTIDDPTLIDCACLMVTTLNDSGDGSLREAINCANINPVPDVIKFDLSGAEPYTITINSPLPILTDNGTVIDGTTQPNNTTWWGVTLEGNNTLSDGLKIQGDNCEVYGMRIQNFANGIYISGNNAMIGAYPKRNFIMSNSQNGIYLNAAHNAIIKSNYIGTDILETKDFVMGNQEIGIKVINSNNVHIGGLANREENRIANNGVAIQVQGSTENYIVQNLMFCNNEAIEFMSSAVNNGKLPPTILNATSSVISGTSSPNDYIEIFKQDATDCSGMACQGKRLIGTCYADASGNWVFNDTYLETVIDGDAVVAIATDANENSSVFSDCELVLTAHCNPPTANAALAISGNVVRLNWNEVSGSERYRVRYREIGGAWIEVLTAADETFRFLNALELNTAYQYQLKSLCSSVNSIWSSTYTFTTSSEVCDLPLSSTTTLLNNTDVTISWTTHANDIKYKLKYKPSSNTSPWVEYTSLSVPSKTEVGLSSGIEYKYKIKTKCAGGWTQWSSNYFFTMSNSLQSNGRTNNEESGKLFTTNTKLSPNPAKDELSVNFDNEDFRIIRILNVDGRVLRTIEVKELSITIDILDFSKGVYFISILSSSGIIESHKFIKI